MEGTTTKIDYRNITMSEHGRLMQARSRTPLAEMRRQLTVARNTARKMEARAEAHRLKMAHLEAEVQRLEAEQRTEAAS